MTEIKKLKQQIDKLFLDWDSIQEKYISDLADAESIEDNVTNLIIDYCEKKGYQVEGFPHEKRKTIREDEADDYFHPERFQLYINTLATTHDDVAQLIWHYHNTFWPNDELWPNKDALVKYIRENLGNTDYYVEGFLKVGKCWVLRCFLI